LEVKNVTLLIIDDEPYLTDSLYNAITNYDKLSFEVFKAYSSSQALEIIKKVRVDIILSDICMPEVNGIEFLNQIQLYCPYSKVIFLTGFDNFEYIQTAIRKKAVDFILKVEGDKPIFDALHQAVSEIDEDKRNSQYIENAKKQLNRALPLLQNKYLMDIISGYECCTNEMQMQFTELNIPFNCSMPVQIFIGQVDYWRKDLGLSEKAELLYSIQDIAGQYLSASATVVPVMCNYNRILWITQPKEFTQDGCISENEIEILQRVSQFVYSTIDLIQQAIHVSLDLSVSFSVSKIPVLWEYISVKYNRLEKLLQKVSGITCEVILSDDMEPSVRTTSMEREEKKFEQKVFSELKKINLLDTYLESGQADEFIHTLKEILSCIDSQKQKSYILVRKVYYSVAMVFLAYVENLDKREILELEENYQLEILMKMESHSSWNDITLYFVRLAQEIFKQKSDEYMKTTDKIIQNIHLYIQENLGNDISLNKLAEICHFNPFYLSRLYKQATGKSISEYISEYKFEKARELLKYDSMRINEISSTLGFANASYFSRFFKKYSNMSPQEYRNSLL